MQGDGEDPIKLVTLTTPWTEARIKEKGWHWMRLHMGIPPDGGPPVVRLTGLRSDGEYIMSKQFDIPAFQLKSGMEPSPSIDCVNLEDLRRILNDVFDSFEEFRNCGCTVEKGPCERHIIKEGK